ncbi:MAG: prepilin-type N-terminal cleavage/methylation domain-containing protein [Elusimicrobiaceae bacterium]|nr:prepilin-type N-terminal cleavage/methylation domain-containing protein [Elusimicrobiaceae bacterium]
MNNKKGFTLIELLVVVLIIGILAAMAMPQYFKAVERSRMTEADTLLGSIAQAQRRKFLQRNSFTTNYKGLDVSPKDSSGSTYYTKGNPTTGANGNGFAVVLTGANFTDGRATATRHAASGALQYQYSLVRYYQGDNVTCNGTNTAGQELCADFCGIDNPTASCCNNGSSSACAAPTNNN